ncbi:uncharacterized protein LOC130894190 isoform X1 [Diorhabda carinulata]|uniref:uncharacterized protein LOC130894190 isoform X1 n=2 Tax=Diorhabda carinulata TaxID=1163345 RepID=UPI0025A16E77|nr:uncharacterized protein LOC130894190 isoform X1 [Diorhabda carinulata]
MMTFGILVWFLICYFVLFLIGLVTATGETVSVNKPILKSTNSWHFSTDYVRCFCNLPTCMMTGYMCKSSNGGCFSDVPESTDHDKGRHGCLELLEQKYRCHGKTGINEKTTFRKKENTKSRLMCCHYDMCNHIENPQTKNLMNATKLVASPRETDAKYQKREEKFLYSDSEVWFRAATIAVPICGAVILFVLIALAVKILKSEHQNSSINKLGPTLYIQPVSHQKNAKEKCNQNNFHRTYDNLLRKDYVTSPHNNFYCTHVEEYPGQFHEPLIQRESTTSDEKNRNQTRYNLVNYEDSGKSIILEIEKEKPPRSEVNYTAEVNKFPVQKTFLS